MTYFTVFYGDSIQNEFHYFYYLKKNCNIGKYVNLGGIKLFCKFTGEFLKIRVPSSTLLRTKVKVPPSEPE